MAAIAGIKEKQASEWNSGPSLWIKICIFQQGLINQIFQSTEFKKTNNQTPPPSLITNKWKQHGKNFFSQHFTCQKNKRKCLLA